MVKGKFWYYYYYTCPQWSEHRARYLTQSRRCFLRRLFMQETLNKMVASVRHGVLGPEEASRSIHECAALLGLQLATEIPVTTLIITGMRKTVTAGDMIDAFSEFGEISEAAVASNQRGFGAYGFERPGVLISLGIAISHFFSLYSSPKEFCDSIRTNQWMLQ
jgi:hypothetical protein